ncbi:MAG: NAD(P)-dependent oxidoreductase [Bryobacterales bacterium]|nr:NAD(P)-dependent oxidoreductase [Bryobacterales bacterium]
MRIFLAGAGGTLGIPLLRQLITDGHEVTAMTRSSAKRGVLETMGARPVVVDVFDATALRDAVAKAKPEVVVNLLTALPAAGPLRYSHLEPTNRLRTEGARNLLEAAAAGEARRMVAESFASAVVELSPGHPMQPTIDALHSLEAQHAEASRAGRMETVVLRYGLFYGPGVPSTRDLIHNLRMGRMALPKNTPGRASWVHVHDAVSATVAAISRRELPKSLYDIADDEPLTMREAMGTAAGVLGLRPPRTLPEWLFRLLAPVPAAFTWCSMVLDNRDAKRDLEWLPLYPNQAAGYGAFARDWGIAA